MKKLYFLVAGCVIVGGAYVCGLNVGDAKCDARITRENLQNIQNLQIESIKTKRTNHEIVYKTGVDDIRRILRDKYTIAE